MEFIEPKGAKFTQLCGSWCCIDDEAELHNGSTGLLYPSPLSANSSTNNDTEKSLNCSRVSTFHLRAMVRMCTTTMQRLRCKQGDEDDGDTNAIDRFLSVQTDYLAAKELLLRSPRYFKESWVVYKTNRGLYKNGVHENMD